MSAADPVESQRTVKDPVELQWTVNGLNIAGLCWGSAGARPVLALHGWLDNAASFAVLGPLLPERQVVALNLTGHGRSDRRSADSGYQIWEDLPEVLGVLEALGWREFDLIGHSRGAVISTLLASTHPERVRRLAMLDAVVTRPVEERAFVQQLRHFLTDKQRLLGRQNRVFPTPREAVASRMKSDLGEAAAELIALRNLRSCDGGYTWRTDPRLHAASAVKMTAGHQQAVLQGLTMPCLLLLAEQGRGAHAEMAELARECVADLTLVRVPGGHHFHMEQGAPQIAQLIEQFFAEEN